MIRLKCLQICLAFVASLPLLVLGHSKNYAGSNNEVTDYDEYTHKDYSLVIDAGVAETKFHLYAFTYELGLPMKILNPYNGRVQPEYRFFLEKPKAYTETLEELVNVTKTHIPKKAWSRTLVSFIASGLRLVPEEKAKKLLDAVRNYLKTTGFKMDKNSVSSMNGRKKIFSWLTVNLLTERLEKKPSRTASVIDLGKGASHVALVPRNMSSLKKWQKELLSRWTAYHRTFDVFSYSVYGLGLTQARIKILEKSSDPSGKHISPCIAPGKQTTWWMNKVYKIEGEKRDKVNFTRCQALAKEVVNEYNTSVSLFNTRVYLMSGFYESIVESKLIKKTQNMELTVQDLIAHAKNICEDPSVKSTFLCMDLIYEQTLLRKMYGLKKTSKVNFNYEINGKTVIWALGAAFDKYEREVLSAKTAQGKLPKPTIKYK